MTRFIGPDEHHKGEMGGPEQNDAHTTDCRGRQEQSHGADAEERDQVLFE